MSCKCEEITFTVGDSFVHPVVIELYNFETNTYVPADITGWGAEYKILQGDVELVSEIGDGVEIQDAELGIFLIDIDDMSMFIPGKALHQFAYIDDLGNRLTVFSSTIKILPSL